ncbi:putative Pentatricopeptide repeat-containing protein [Quillaja saponaria]|uniref:Pentatricopeptide repeat-containing protein n=1 Tax=Quillaja saponaria TaxID=32244 RepID=A0AAD7L510_QUISA|nr:putative Pentatricopeptide repeat-containing protein [Quillaja saponaria]
MVILGEDADMEVALAAMGEDLENCIGLLKKWDLVLNPYNFLLQSYLRYCDSSKAFDVYMELQRRGYKLDIFANNMQLRALAKDARQDHFFSSQKWWRMIAGPYSVLLNVLVAEGQLRKNDTIVEGYLYAMLESLCSTGKTTEAIDLLDKIHEKASVEQEMMMRLLKIFEDSEHSDCKPDVISYNFLINCLGKNGGLDEAHMRFKETQEKGLNPDVVTYSTLIECIGKTVKVEMACRLFIEMLAEGCCPNIITYNILLDCLERSGRTAEAVDLYAKLSKV